MNFGATAERCPSIPGLYREKSPFEEFARRMDALCHAHRIGEPEPWLDNQQVCLLLNISKRTLQTLRGNGSLSYTQINHKIYYRAEDVRLFLAVLEARRKHEQKRRNGV